MMKAELKRLHSPDIHDLRNYRPENPESFGIFIQVIIGPEGAPGDESFDLTLCTPRWLEETCPKDEVIFGFHHLITREYDYDRIVQTITRFLNGCSGDNWNQVATKVSRLGWWEFEDYSK